MGVRRRTHFKKKNISRLNYIHTLKTKVYNRQTIHQIHTLKTFFTIINLIKNDYSEVRSRYSVPYIYIEK